MVLNRRALVVVAAVSVGVLVYLTSTGEKAPTVHPTFNRHIAPLVFKHCAPCHRPGESAPFSLLTYSDVHKRARQIVAVTARRLMPPWLPEPDHGEFLDDRRLNKEQIDSIRLWVEEGALEGSPADLPPLPTWTTGWQLGEPDLVIETEIPYTLPAEGSDVFRNFVIPIPVKKRRYVAAVEFRPGNPKLVHHAVFMIDPTRKSLFLDAEDPEPGYTSMFIGEEAQAPDGHFLGWTPGKIPVRNDARSWRLDPGSHLVAQLHMLPTGQPKPVEFRVGFFFSDRPPKRVPFMIRLGSKTQDIPAGEKRYVIKDSYVLPVDVELLLVYPHAHYLAREMKGSARLPDGTKLSLIYIKEWDFNWQDDYRYRAPIFLPRGTALSMEYTYDNSADNIRNPHSPPEHVVYGPRSSDEMGDLWLQVLPKRREDLAILKGDFSRKEVFGNIAANRFKLSIDPDDAEAHYQLGTTLVRIGQGEEGLKHLRQSLKIRPDFADAYNSMGNHYSQLGKAAEAATMFTQAIRVNPDFDLAYTNLGHVFHARKRFKEAKAQFEHALAIHPDSAAAHYGLGLVLSDQGELAAAEERFRRVLRVEPEHMRAYLGLGVALERQGRSQEAENFYAQTLALYPRFSEAHYQLGNLFFRQGRLHKAKAQYERALGLNPGFSLARKSLSLVKERLGE
jgi:tetratricopeptide (TPR) repeat protein